MCSLFYTRSIRGVHPPGTMKHFHPVSDFKKICSKISDDLFLIIDSFYIPFYISPNTSPNLFMYYTRRHHVVGRDAALVESITFNRRVVGLTPALAVT